MSEMIERVAREISACCKNDSDWELRKRMARAAIEAMREPTEKMIEAGTVGWDALDGSGIRPMFAPQRPYRAMIDAALK